MSGIARIGLDIAKPVFHAHGADERGPGVFSKCLTRAELLASFAARSYSFETPATIQSEDELACLEAFAPGRAKSSSAGGGQR